MSMRGLFKTGKPAGLLSCLLVAVLTLIILPAAAAASWIIKGADVEPLYSFPTSKSIAIDPTTNLPHMAFGGDYLYHAYYDGTKWNIEKVDETSRVGSHASMAIDAQGAVHISYYDSLNGELRYATNEAGPWMTIVLDTGSVGQYTSIAVNSGGKVYISYYDASNTALKYVTNRSGSWDIPTIIDSGQIASTSIAVDSADSVHISYYNYTSKTVRYVSKSSGGSWSSPRDISELNASFASMALDPNGKPHISYHINYQLKHATPDAMGTWNTELVSSSASRFFGTGSSIGIGSDGVIHISCADTMNQKTWYAENSQSGIWNVQAIDLTGSPWLPENFTSLAVDANNKVHIAYYRNAFYDFRYATNTSGIFINSQVAIAGDPGVNSSIALDSTHKAHIAYYDGNLRSLKYVSNAAGWVPQLIDSTNLNAGDDIWQYSRIVLDSSGKAHIGYAYTTNFGANSVLKYATNASGSWVTSTVDTTGDLYAYISLALDSSGKAHISYYDATTHRLKYANNVSVGWTASTIENTRDFGQFNSIAVDSAGTVHISAFDATNNYIAYYTNALNGGIWSLYMIEGCTGKVNSSIAVDPLDNVHIAYYNDIYHSVRYASGYFYGSFTPTDIGAGAAQYDSFAVDSLNHVHISYYDAASLDLIYTTNASGSWATTTIDSPGDVGNYSSIAVDSNRKVHISYHDTTNTNLKYATNALVDITPPGGTVSIAGGAVYTNTTSVTLSLSCMDLQSSCSQMQFSNDRTLWSDPRPFASSTNWVLTSGNGLKTVYAKFQDSWGNWSETVLDTINLDSSPPTGGFNINSGAVSTNSDSVSLGLTCSDGTGGSGCDLMRISNDGAAWTTYTFSTPITWTLSAGDGLKTVRVQLRDIAGTWSSTVSNTITLDTTPPNSPLVSGATPTNDTTPTWSWNSGGSGGSGNYRYKLDSSDLTTGATATTSLSYSPAVSEGPHTLYVQESDSLGNWSASGSLAITVDITPPNKPAVTGTTPTNNARPTWTWYPGGGGGSANYRYKLDDTNLELGATITTSTTYTPISGLGDGSHKLYVEERDAVGNWSAFEYFEIIIDASGPSTHATPSAAAYGTPISVNLTCNDGTGTGCDKTYYCLGAGCNPLTEYSSSITVDASTTLRYYSVDRLGNIEIQAKEDIYTFTSGYTQLSLETSNPTIPLNGTLTVWGRLQNLSANGADPTGETIKLKIWDPKGIELAPITTSVYDSYGDYQIPNVNVFTQKGPYSLQAVYENTNSGILGASQSTPMTVMVGASAGYAVIVVGKISTDPEGLKSHAKTADRIYTHLKSRGFSDENIYYLSYQNATGVDGMPSRANVQYAIEEWAGPRMKGVPAPLYVIMVDHGSTNAFYTGSETITPTDLNTWLANLETSLTTGADANPDALLEKRVVIVGACYSGSFISTLKQAPVSGNAGRMIITSAAANEVSYKGPEEPSEGGVTVRSGEFFLDEFFNLLGNDKTFKEAFEEATSRTEVFTKKGGTNPNSNAPYYDGAVQHPQLEDNGDGTGSNTLDANGDGTEASNLKLGVANFGTNSALNPAVVTAVTETKGLIAGSGNTTATLWGTVNDNNEVDSAVWVEIRNPSLILNPQSGSIQQDLQLTKRPMTWNGGMNRWEYTYDQFTEAGAYEVYYFVRDMETKLLSPMKRSLVYKDRDNNTVPSAFDLISPAEGLDQTTTLVLDWADSTDTDGLTYTVEIAKALPFSGSNIIYTKEEIPYSNTLIGPEANLAPMTTYYWRVWAVDVYGATTRSNLNQSGVEWSFNTDNNSLPGRITGRVTDASTGLAVGSASILFSTAGTVSVNPDGTYSWAVPTGAVDITVSANNYQPYTLNGYNIPPTGETVTLNIGLSPSLTVKKGDVNGDNKTNIVDALLIARYAAGLSVSNFNPAGADVNCDGVTNIVDALLIARKAAGLAVASWCGN